MKRIFQRIIGFFRGLSQPETHSKRSFPEVQNILDLEKTDFVATLEQAINIDQNQVYCPTLLFAWDELRNLLDNKPKVKTNDHELWLINESESFQESLSTEEMQITVEANLEQMKIRIEVLFLKSLPFKRKFESNIHQLNFGSTAVNSFGLNGNWNDAAEQLDILFYISDQDFAIRLQPEDPESEILLYLGPENEKASLGEMLNAFYAKWDEHTESNESFEKYGPYSFNSRDILCIPVLNFHLKKDYHSLIGRNFECNDVVFQITEANQRTALLFDETGAEIESKAVLEVDWGWNPDTNKLVPKKLIFNKPFLLIFKKKNTPQPYLVCWIANEELMERRKTK